MPLILTITAEDVDNPEYIIQERAECRDLYDVIYELENVTGPRFRRKAMEIPWAVLIRRKTPPPGIVKESEKFRGRKIAAIFYAKKEDETVTENAEAQPPAVGDFVIFVNPVGNERNALITAVWGTNEFPSINLVYVNDDETATDQYGRQLAQRVTSCVHESNQYAHGNYWKLP